MKKTDKKNPKGEQTNWNKTLFVVIAVMIAFAMVGTYVLPLLTPAQAVQAGEIAVIGYTIRDDEGNAILTTDQQVLTGEMEKGNYMVVFTQGMEIPAGMAVSGENIATVPIDQRWVDFAGFGILGYEINSISAAVVGMKTGETRSTTFDYKGNQFQMNFSAEDAEGIGIDFANATVGDKLPLGFTDTPDIGSGANSTAFSMRIGEIVNKTEDNLVIKYRYKSADITLQGIGAGQ